MLYDIGFYLYKTPRGGAQCLQCDDSDEVEETESVSHPRTVRERPALRAPVCRPLCPLRL